MTGILSSKVASFLAAFTAIQCAFGCITNSVVLLYFLLARGSLETTSDKLILNLAVADFLALSTYVPWLSHLVLQRAVTKYATIYRSLFIFCIFSTGNAILLIGLDKFIAVSWPLTYKAIVTFKAFWVSVISSWFSAILFAVGHGLSYRFGIHREYDLFLSALSLSQLILLSTIYVVLVRTARNHSQNIARRLGSFAANQIYSLGKTIRATFAIVCLFYATLLPYVVYKIVSTADRTMSSDEKLITWCWITAFTFLNSCFDPIVYFFGMKKYRVHLRRGISERSTSNIHNLDGEIALRGLTRAVSTV